MMKNTMRFAVIWLLSAWLPSYAATSDTPPFYQISYKGNTAYLLGSIHVGKANFYPLAAQVERAFANAGALVLEADVNQADAGALLQRYGFSPQPMDKLTQRKMRQFCVSRQPLCQQIKPYSPWLQAVQLEMIQFATLGYAPEWGVEMQLMAKNGSRPIYELESTEFQFSLLASFDVDVQWSMVRETIATTDAQLELMVKAWRNGDKQLMQQLLEKQLQTPQQQRLMVKLLWQRNQNMANEITRLMSESTTSKPLFIAVGSLHLSGDKSLPNYLDQLGATLIDCWQDRCRVH